MPMSDTEATQENTVPAKKKVYVNVNFEAIAAGINQGAAGDCQFNGKGRKINSLAPDYESNYVYYSSVPNSEPKGKNNITPPISINKGQKVKFILQPWPGTTPPVDKKWKDITQSEYCLQSVPGEKGTYIGIHETPVKPKPQDDDDAVTFHVKFDMTETNSKGTIMIDKYLVSWDPAVRIRK